MFQIARCLQHREDGSRDIITLFDILDGLTFGREWDLFPVVQDSDISGEGIVFCFLFFLLTEYTKVKLPNITIVSNSYYGRLSSSTKCLTTLFNSQPSFSTFKPLI